MRIRTTGTRFGLAAVTALVIAGAGCGGSDSGGSGGGGSSSASGTPQSGGSVIIDRVADSQSMDKTTVFDNESIWVFEQIMEPLYTVSKDGKDVEPWLATSYTLSPDKMTYTFKLRQGVKFSNGQPMTSADVKFSIDAARGRGRLGLHRRRDQGHRGAGSRDGRDPHASTRGRRSSPTSRSSPTASSPRTTAARPRRSSTPTRSAPARSCGTTGTRATSSS